MTRNPMWWYSPDGSIRDRTKAPTSRPSTAASQFTSPGETWAGTTAGTAIARINPIMMVRRGGIFVPPVRDLHSTGAGRHYTFFGGEVCRMRRAGITPTMMRPPRCRNACFVLASVVDLLFLCSDPRDALTVRLPWRRSVRRRRRAFPEDVLPLPSPPKWAPIAVAPLVRRSSPHPAQVFTRLTPCPLAIDNGIAVVRVMSALLRRNDTFSCTPIWLEELMRPCGGLSDTPLH